MAALRTLVMKNSDLALSDNLFYAFTDTEWFRELCLRQ